MRMNLPIALTNPIVSVAVRTILGAYVIYMARRFYIDPLGYFRKSLRTMPEMPWLAAAVRAMACFCLWGGCFIIATAFAVQIFGFHGDVLALVLVAVAGCATWLLLPKRPLAEDADSSPGGNRGRLN